LVVLAIMASHEQVKANDLINDVSLNTCWDFL